MPAIPVLARQVATYGAVGFVQIGLDWLCFVALTFLGLPAGGANLIARIAGASAGFWLNGKWTFASADKSTLSRRAMGRFLISWMFTTAISTLVVMLVDQAHGLHWAWFVKPVADALLAVVGFTISKFWIYR